MPTHTEEHAAAKSGELVLLDYELWAEGGAKRELIGTTRPEVARGANVPLPEGETLGPQPHLLGGDYFPSGIESALDGAKFGEEFEREFAPADAFGERDPKLIELFGMHEISRLPEMRRKDAELDVGTVLSIRGRRGRVVSLTAARVRVDFNPAFSGRKVKGTFRLVERIKEPAEQVRALIELTYGRGKEFQIETHGHVVTIQVPDRAKFDPYWTAAKPRLIDRVRSQLHPTSIKLVEEYVTPAAKEKDEKKEKVRTGEKAPADVEADPTSQSPAEKPEAARPS